MHNGGQPLGSFKGPLGASTNSIAQFVRGYRLRHLAAQRALEGPPGAPVNIDAIAQDIVPWRRIGVFSLMPLVRRVVYASLLAVMLLNNLLMVLWFARSAVADRLCSYLSYALRPLAAMLPVFNRIQISPSAIGIRNVETVRDYWTISVGTFLVLAGAIVLVAAIEFALNPRVITAIAFVSVRGLTRGMTYVIVYAASLGLFLFWIIFFKELGQLPGWLCGTYGKSVKLAILSGFVVGTIHLGALFCLWGVVMGSLSVTVRFGETMSRVLRRLTKSDMA